ncbi:MAG: ankyrin repeat domain-containing protein [Magnetococcales bacterium]|nr:ankyrin repeat domain-containing protein [Magnetococcales bacterium]
MSVMRVFRVAVLVTVGLGFAGPAGADHISYATTILEKSSNLVNVTVKELILKKKFDELQSYLATKDVNAQDDKRIGPIHIASHYGSIEALRFLIARGANVAAPAFGGWSTLHYAAQSGHTEIANLLVAMGISPNIKDVGGESPLFYAIETNQLSMVRWLVEHGADPLQPNNAGETPLARAEHEKNKAIIDLLQERVKPASPPK